MAQRSAGNGWTRDEVNLRLSARRSRLLRDIAKRLPEGASPTDAIDYAIASCFQAEAAQSDLYAEIERSADLREEARRDDAQRFEAAVARLAEGMERLHALISDAADEGRADG